MEDILLGEIISALFPNVASMILSILFGIGLYKFIYGKYLDGYYDDDI